MTGNERRTPDGGAAARDAGWTVARLVQRMEGRGNAPAILSLRGDDLKPHSFAELAGTVRRLAAGLRAAGFEPGAPAAIFAPNAPEWIAVALALNTAGALVVPVDDVAGDAHARSVIADSGAKWIFTARAHLAALRAMPGAESFRIHLFDAPGVGEEMSWRSLLAPAPAPLPELRPDWPACLFYTSGTTGEPKGFVLTHANIGTNVQALAAERLVGPGDRALVPLPLHHAYPYIVGMLTSLETGMAIVLPESATGPHIAKALRAGRVTVVVGVPRLYQALVNGITARIAAHGRIFKPLFSAALAFCAWAQERFGVPAGRALLGPIRRRIAPDLRLLISGGARLEAELSRTLETFGWQPLAGYGLAETSSVFTGNLPRRKRLGSAGVPLADGEVRIANPDESGMGEIELRGGSITGGYRNNPEANRAAFTPDGWFRTGDLGYLDADGFLFVTGRATETIVLGGGKKVNPEDLEKAYGANPVIGEVALLERGGRLVALVRPEPSRLREIGTLNVEHAVRVALAEAAQALPAYERLAGFAVTSRPLPRTQLGKYRRFLLPPLYDEAKSGVKKAARPELSAEDRRFLENPAAARAWEIVKARYAERGAALDSHLALDLGVDSLEWMTLSLELEASLGVALAEEDMARIETVRDLFAALIRAGAAPPAEARVQKERAAAERERWLRPTGPVLTLVGFFLFALDKILMRVFFRLRAEGLAHLPKTGACLIVANHASDLDPLAVAAALPFPQLRRAYWAGDVARLFGSGMLRRLCRAVHLYPIDERLPAAAIETASLVLSRGNIQIWFPEAWRSPDGRLQRFLPGVGELVVKTRAPAVPAYISGTFRAMPRTRRWPRRHPVRVVFGRAVDAETLQSRGRGARAEDRAADALQAEVRALAASIGEDV